MELPAAAEDPQPQVVFRPSKKRKQFRQRAEENDTQTDDATSQAPAPATAASNAGAKDEARGDNDYSETEARSVADALRLRNARKSRPKGVEFRPEGPPQEETLDDLIRSQAPKDEVAEQLELGMSRRFAPPAGLVGELVNKHM